MATVYLHFIDIMAAIINLSILTMSTQLYMCGNIDFPHTMTCYIKELLVWVPMLEITNKIEAYMSHIL